MICLTFWRLFGLLVATDILARIISTLAARFTFRLGRWKLK